MTSNESRDPTRQQPVLYWVSSIPVASLRPDELIQEADDLKREILTIEMRMGERRAWFRAEGSQGDYLIWLAKSKNFYARLMIRYTIVRAAVKAHNRRRSVK